MAYELLSQSRKLKKQGEGWLSNKSWGDWKIFEKNPKGRFLGTPE